MSIKWVDAPPQPGTRGRKAEKRPRYWSFAQALRKHPLAWAELGKLNTSVAYQIGHGQTAAFRPAGAFEAVSRNTGKDGRATIFVRYIGEPEAES